VRGCARSYGTMISVKLYPVLTAFVIFAAYGQTPAPKPADATGQPTPQHVTPGQLAAPAPGSATAADPNHVVATVGSEKITVAQLNNIINGLPPQYQAQARGPGKRQFIDQLVQIKLLAQQAVDLHLDQLATTQQQISFARENILANAAGRQMMETAKVDDDAVKKYYEDHKNEFESASAHHILIRFKGSPVPLKEGQKELTDEEALAKAQEIEKRLKAGEDFEAIAKAESADVGSGAKGGDLGNPFKHGQMVKPFEEAAFSMKEGQISDPVKTQFGYHIIRLDKLQTKTLDEARPEIEAKLKPEMAKKRIDELQKSAGVTIDDSFFGPAPAPTTPTLQNVK
jgi:peptidyl-prolyl cis-trans isomerase C